MQLSNLLRTSVSESVGSYTAVAYNVLSTLMHAASTLPAHGQTNTPTVLKAENIRKHNFDRKPPLAWWIGELSAGTLSKSCQSHSANCTQQRLWLRLEKFRLENFSQQVALFLQHFQGAISPLGVDSVGPWIHLEHTSMSRPLAQLTFSWVLKFALECLPNTISSAVLTKPRSQVLRVRRFVL